MVQQPVCSIKTVPGPFPLFNLLELLINSSLRSKLLCYRYRPCNLKGDTNFSNSLNYGSHEGSRINGEITERSRDTLSLFIAV